MAVSGDPRKVFKKDNVRPSKHGEEIKENAGCRGHRICDVCASPFAGVRGSPTTQPDDSTDRKEGGGGTQQAPQRKERNKTVEERGGPGGAPTRGGPAHRWSSQPGEEKWELCANSHLTDLIF